MKLDHVVVYVADFEAALTFYEDVLGLEKIFSEGDIARLKAGAVSILLHDGQPKAPLPTFRVDDIGKTVAELREAGLSVPEPVEEGWGKVTRFKDGSGNLLCIFQQ